MRVRVANFKLFFIFMVLNAVYWYFGFECVTSRSRQPTQTQHRNVFSTQLTNRTTRSVYVLLWSVYTTQNIMKLVLCALIHFIFVMFYGIFMADCFILMPKVHFVITFFLVQYLKVVLFCQNEVSGDSLDNFNDISIKTYFSNEMHLAWSIWTTATQIQDCSNGENGLYLQYVSQHNYPCQRQNSCDHEYWQVIIWIMWNTQWLILRQWCPFWLDRIILGFPRGTVQLMAGTFHNS